MVFGWKLKKKKTIKTKKKTATVWRHPLISPMSPISVTLCFVLDAVALSPESPEADHPLLERRRVTFGYGSKIG